MATSRGEDDDDKDEDDSEWQRCIDANFKPIVICNNIRAVPNNRFIFRPNSRSNSYLVSGQIVVVELNTNSGHVTSVSAYASQRQIQLQSRHLKFFCRSTTNKKGQILHLMGSV